MDLVLFCIWKLKPGEFTNTPETISVIAGIVGIPKKLLLPSHSIQPLPEESQTSTGYPGLILSLFSWFPAMLSAPITFLPFCIALYSPPQGLSFLAIPHLLCTYVSTHAITHSSFSIQAMHSSMTTGDASPAERLPDKRPPSFRLKGRPFKTHTCLPLHQITVTHHSLSRDSKMRTS